MTSEWRPTEAFSVALAEQRAVLDRFNRTIDELREAVAYLKAVLDQINHPKDRS